MTMKMATFHLQSRVVETVCPSLLSSPGHKLVDRNTGQQIEKYKDKQIDTYTCPLSDSRDPQAMIVAA